MLFDHDQILITNLLNLNRHNIDDRNRIEFLSHSWYI